jgi:hypothetical protein
MSTRGRALGAQLGATERSRQALAESRGPDRAVLPFNLPHLTRRDAPHADLTGPITSRVAQNSSDDPDGHIDSASTSTLLQSWHTIT